MLLMLLLWLFLCFLWFINVCCCWLFLIVVVVVAVVVLLLLLLLLLCCRLVSLKAHVCSVFRDTESNYLLSDIPFSCYCCCFSYCCFGLPFLLLIFSSFCYCCFLVVILLQWFCTIVLLMSCPLKAHVFRGTESNYILSDIPFSCCCWCCFGLPFLFLIVLSFCSCCCNFYVVVILLFRCCWCCCYCHCWLCGRRGKR